MNTRDEVLDALRDRWGDAWEVWYVPLALGGERWCARRHGDELRNVLHADRPDHLGEYIANAENERAAGP